MTLSLVSFACSLEVYCYVVSKQMIKSCKEHIIDNYTMKYIELLPSIYSVQIDILH